MLFAFDLDATVVTRDYELPPSIQQAIKAIRKAGHEVTVITGRTKASAMAYLASLNIEAYYAVNHGATIFAEHGFLSKIEVEPELVAFVLEHYHGEESECFFYEGDRIFVADPKDSRWFWTERFAHRLIAHDDYQKHHVDKITIVDAKRSSQIYQELLNEFPDLSHYHWEGFGLEITGVGGTKGEALKQLAAHYGVRQEDTVAFGDGVNDIAMLAWAGYAVAVGKNAHKEVLALADEVIAPPEEDGVGQWLRQHYLS